MNLSMLASASLDTKKYCMGSSTSAALPHCSCSGLPAPRGPHRGLLAPPGCRTGAGGGLASSQPMLNRHRRPKARFRVDLRRGGETASPLQCGSVWVGGRALNCFEPHSLLAPLLSWEWSPSTSSSHRLAHRVVRNLAAPEATEAEPRGGSVEPSTALSQCLQQQPRHVDTARSAARYCAYGAAG